MTGPRQLKVYRTAIGFHDAYVAAPNQKAALAAWGSDVNLFARGVAELVDDPALTAEPLAHPGAIIKRLRGSAAEQLAALPATKPARQKRELAEAASKPKTNPPSRRAFEATEAALKRLKADQAAEAAALQREEQALARRRREMERAHVAAQRQLTEARDQAQADYDRAMRQWEA